MRWTNIPQMLSQRPRDVPEESCRLEGRACCQAESLMKISLPLLDMPHYGPPMATCTMHLLYWERKPYQC
jgi:hypothetical protein